MVASLYSEMYHIALAIQVRLELHYDNCWKASRMPAS